MSKSAIEIVQEISAFINTNFPKYRHESNIPSPIVIDIVAGYANTKEKWISDKPEFTEDCWIVTSGSDGREIWEIKKVYSEDGWYWGWLDSYGDEYGDINDLESESYYILPEPPKEKKNEKE